jgi:hypothetical protein
VPEIGTHVTLTGQFDDPAAATCRSVPWVNIGFPLPNPADAVAVCRRSFVASGIPARHAVAQHARWLAVAS